MQVEREELSQSALCHARHFAMSHIKSTQIKDIKICPNGAIYTATQSTQSSPKTDWLKTQRYYTD